VVDRIAHALPGEWVKDGHDIQQTNLRQRGTDVETLPAARRLPSERVAICPRYLPTHLLFDPVRELYIDTSVIGGYHDPEWMADTRLLWQQAQAGQWHLLTSIVAEAEVAHAPAKVRQVFAETFGPGSILDTCVEVEDLADAYMAAAVVPPKYVDDAMHVAMATVHGVLLIVSWNFKHLVNVRREDAFNAVNVLRGWPLVCIVSPNEIIHADPNSPD
jgi:predicted nucleic acid-binding protein